MAWRIGDQGVILRSVEDGVRAERVTVTEIGKDVQGTVWVKTTGGEAVIDPDDGSGRLKPLDERGYSQAALVPMDPEVAEDLATYGDGFLIEPTLRDLDPLDRYLDDRRIEDRGRGNGIER